MNITDRRGETLAIVITIATVIIIALVAIIPQAVNQRQMAKSQADNIRAFYAAESGANRALAGMNTGDWSDWDTTTDPALYTLSLQSLEDSGGGTVSYYSATCDMTDPENPVAEGTGYSPDTGGAKKAVRVNIRRSQAAITAKGGVVIKGNAQVNGEILEYAEFSFANIFEDTKENIKNDDTQTELVVDPANNYTPVPEPEEPYTDLNTNGQWDDGEPYTDNNANGQWDDEARITWFELDSASEAMIAQDAWSGHGILIVEDGDLKITGGTFKGIIWVMGDLQIAGNATIDGSIFVDGNVEDITSISGTPNITYDAVEIISAFGKNPMPFVKDSWREFYK